MLDFDLDKMLFTIPAEKHDEKEIAAILEAHPEVKFVSLTGVDLGNHNTDEKIPMKAFVEDMAKILWDGVQTDGSSVALPLIAELSNARVDILPDKEVNWYVEYNFMNIDYKTGLPVGTLRIPSFLRHNNERMVGSRIYARRLTKKFRRGLMELIQNNPYVTDYIGGRCGAHQRHRTGILGKDAGRPGGPGSAVYLPRTERAVLEAHHRTGGNGDGADPGNSGPLRIRSGNGT